MKKHGTTITLFLMDGNASGRIRCRLANWTGIAYKIPRTDLDKCKENDESKQRDVHKHLQQTGVYFLFGESEDTGKGLVYIGQAGVRKNGEGLLLRLNEHKRNKDYWTEAIVFTTSNNSFGPTEISYLENRFYNLAVEANRYDVKNDNDPTIGNITEEKESEMEAFIDYAKVVMGTLGHKVFEPYFDISSPDRQEDGESVSIESIDLYLEHTMRNGEKVKATGRQTPDGFVVFSGSIISTQEKDVVTPKIKERRRTARIDERGVLLEDALFSSPTYAAMFVVGNNSNGRTAWKTKDNKTLKSLEEKGQ